MRVTTVADRLALVQERVARAAERAGRSPAEVTIVAVSKSFPASAIEEAAAAGIAHIGENRVQEAAAKIPSLRHLPVTWHLVGHLQTNKAKTALDLFDIIHSMDSLRLAEVLSHRAERALPVLLEVNVVGEAGKFGFSPQEALQAAEAVARLPRLEVRGLMTVAPLTRLRRAEEVRPIFRDLRRLRDALGLPELSMGMTDDFEVAIEEGATLVRIGRAIFGERQTPGGNP
ncbi:MAG: YggS family pyridoxal phosphate-dependent enzyme [Chloroflexota bacterium]|nr:YggS family pyridoxal phosphate-dependent enzyme [Chloroflexota bacterium]